MDFRDVARLSLTDYERALRRALQDLTPVELRTQPSPTANHILWLFWHIGRMEDMWWSYLSGEPEIWESASWSDRLAIETSRNGYGDTPEDIANFPDLTLDQVDEYWLASRANLLSVIEALGPDDLGTSYSGRGRDPAPNVAWVLARIPVEISQHVGQIAYIRGLLRGPGK